MNLEEAKLILLTATKSELRDHAFGDCEVEWYVESTNVAHGYFSGTTRSVNFSGGGAIFHGKDADELRNCYGEEVVERNDETGLTKEAVLREITTMPQKNYPNPEAKDIRHAIREGE